MPTMRGTRSVFHCLSAVPILGLLACGKPLPLKVEHGGCDNILRGPVCEFRPGGSLHFWVSSAPGAAVTITSEGGQLFRGALPDSGEMTATVQPGKGDRQL